MSLKVFADLMSQPARAVVIFCRAAGIPHEHVNVRITAGDTKTEEYSAMNPFQKVPVLKDGDFVLTNEKSDLGCTEQFQPSRKGELARKEAMRPSLIRHKATVRPEPC